MQQTANIYKLVYSQGQTDVDYKRLTVPLNIQDYTIYCFGRSENTGLFISPSGISELDCTTTKTDTAERSISIGRESLQVFFLY